MTKHAIFVAPFLMAATLRFLEGAASLEGVRLSLISQDPAERVPEPLRRRLAGHWRVGNGLDPEEIVAGARRLQRELGDATCLFGPLEQLQVPLAVAREHLGLAGLSIEAAENFRDKSRMKTVLGDAECALCAPRADWRRRRRKCLCRCGRVTGRRQAAGRARAARARFAWTVDPI